MNETLYPFHATVTEYELLEVMLNDDAQETADRLVLERLKHIREEDDRTALLGECEP